MFNFCRPFLLALLFLFTLPACTPLRPAPSSALLAQYQADIAPTTQLLLVRGKPNSHIVTVWLLERSTALAPTDNTPLASSNHAKNSWLTRLGPLPGVVGSAGFAPPGQKREGDRKSPTGAFTITQTFGTDPTPPSRLPYRLLTDRDVWCEDPASPNYNQWIVVDADDKVVDRLKDSDNYYRHAAVIDYNRWPVIPGAGSAIFLHSADPGPNSAGTFGCVGLSQSDLDLVLGLLRPEDRPMILMGVDESR